MVFLKRAGNDVSCYACHKQHRYDGRNKIKGEYKTIIRPTIIHGCEVWTLTRKVRASGVGKKDVEENI